MFGLSDNKNQQQDLTSTQNVGGEPTGAPSVSGTSAQTPAPPQPIDNNAPPPVGPISSAVDYTSAPPAPSITPTEPPSFGSTPDSTPVELPSLPVEPPAPVPPPAIKMDRPFASTAPPAQPVDPIKHDDIPLMSSHSDDDLIKMKQQALQSLAPLIDHLEQTPEEKFKTTMMLIQASDNAELVKEAFDAANQITDEKARAQALLDVINEINYFTHQETSSGGQETS